MTAFALPTWRALSHFFSCLQGESGCDESQKIWSGSPATLLFSLRGERISQILGKKKTNKFLSQIVREVRMTFMLVKRLPDVPAVSALHLLSATLPNARRSQGSLRGRM